MLEILKKPDFDTFELIAYLKSMGNLNGIYQLKVRHYLLVVYYQCDIAGYTADSGGFAY